MRESLVRFRHSVNVVLLLDRSTAHVRGIRQLIRQLIRHPFVGPAAGVLQNPADGQTHSAVLRYLHRNLIVGATHTPRLHFEQRLGVLHSLLEELQWIVGGALLDLVHCTVENPLRRIFLPIPHHRVDELLRQRGVVNRIRKDLARLWSASAWHSLLGGPFRPFGSVLRSSLFTVGHPSRVERAAHHVITNARQILHTAAADQHDGVLLQIVADTWNISGYFNPIGQAHTRHFPQCRIRLLGGGSVHARTHATLLRTSLQRWTGGLITWRFSPFSHELIKRRHESSLQKLCLFSGTQRQAKSQTAKDYKLRGYLLWTSPYPNG